ncbi:hypothetical protein [uncultured Alistipes sp.]|uniref:hypothetical protein n=1 Tax=uncultured Alistipes sp. TaxID=538949 RepID=UPI002624E979|nr:hypothetical protein [uncultured Alistipes sp.]
MKHLLLFLTALCLAQQAANAQEVTVRMTDDASKSITLDERMTQETVWKRFGVYAYLSYDDTECLNGHIDKYKSEGISFSCLNSKVHQFSLTSDRYRVIIDRVFVIYVGMTIDQVKALIPEERRILREGTIKNTYRFMFRTRSGEFSDEQLVLVADERGRITSIWWQVPV